ncbi:hypothetical protein RVW00_000183 [Enterobacter bugandensis]|nr:hypothetical protein [Enterobacter bugandensis]
MQVLQNAFRLAFEISPIILVDGIARHVPGGAIPIAVFTEGVSMAYGQLLSDSDLTNFTTRFYPMAGTTLIAQEIGTYPFFDMATAANSVVRMPNRISMQMVRPANAENAPYPEKIVTFTALKYALDYHNAKGGSYTILTPACIFASCLMRNMIDISGFSDENKQVQHTWSLEFEQPLLQQDQLEQVMVNVMDKFNDGMPTQMTWSDIGNKAGDWLRGVFT